MNVIENRLGGRKKGNKKGTRRFPAENLVRRVGFEPATPWFVARYSIQLSYRRAGWNYARFPIKLQGLW